MDKPDHQRRRIPWQGMTHSKCTEEKDLRRRTALVTLTYDVVRRVSSKINLHELFSEVVTAVRDAFDYYGVMLLLADEGGDCMSLQAIKGSLDHVVPEDLKIAIGEGMVGNAAATGEIQLSGDVRQDPRYVRVASEPTKSELAVPIKNGEKTIGVLDIQSDQFDAFDAVDVMAMQTLSTHIVTAIENAQLYETVQRKLTEHRRLSQYLESVIDNATIWLNVLDEDGGVVIWNRAAEAISGYSREEVVQQGNDWDRLLYPDEAYRQEVAERTTALYERGETAEEIETTIRCKNGQTKVISWNSRQLLDESGDSMGSIAIVRDVTGLKRAEEALRSSEERFSLAVGGANDGVWDWNIEEGSLYWSPRMKEMLGYANDDLRVDFEAFEALLHPDDKERTRAAIDAHLKDRAPYDMEQRLLTKSGNYIWAHARGQAVWDKDGRAIRMVGVTTDITALKLAAEALRESEARFRAVAETAVDAIVSADSGSSITLWNNGAEVLFGYTESDVTGKPFSHLIADQTSGASGQERQAFKLTGKPQREHRMELVGRKKNGDTFPMELSLTSWEASSGTFYTAIIRDISERVEYEARLARMAHHDALTGAYNRHYLVELLDREIKQAKRYDYPVSFLMIDVDRFKEINDRFGHQIGDRVLQAIASSLEKTVRESDIVIRYGGDEFLVILPRTNGETEVIRQRILEAVANQGMVDRLLGFSVTLSIGSASWVPGTSQSVQETLAEVDRRMYQMKRRER